MTLKVFQMTLEVFQMTLEVFPMTSEVFQMTFGGVPNDLGGVSNDLGGATLNFICYIYNRKQAKLILFRNCVFPLYSTLIISIFVIFNLSDSLLFLQLNFSLVTLKSFFPLNTSISIKFVRLMVFSFILSKEKT